MVKAGVVGVAAFMLRGGPYRLKQAFNLFGALPPFGLFHSNKL